MKTELASPAGRLERADRRESGPPEWRVETVVSKSLPPTLSFIRALVEAVWGFGSSINGCEDR